MKKEDVISYLKIFGGLMLIFPLVHAYFALDFGLMKGGLIALALYVGLMLLAIPLFNYLQYGIFWYFVNDEYRNKYNCSYNSKYNMDTQTIKNKIEKNRKEINWFLNNDLPLDIIYFNVRRLSASNERLIKLLNK